MEALYRMESLCSEAFFGRCRRPVRFIVLFRSVFRAGTVIPFLDNLESFAGTILFCQICPLTVRPSPMPDETEQPDRKIDETGIFRECIRSVQREKYLCGIRRMFYRVL